MQSGWLKDKNVFGEWDCHFLLGIGPKRAIDLIKQYKSIEEIVKHIDTKVCL